MPTPARIRIARMLTLLSAFAPILATLHLLLASLSAVFFALSSLFTALHLLFAPLHPVFLALSSFFAPFMSRWPATMGWRGRLECRSRHGGVNDE